MTAKKIDMPREFEFANDAFILVPEYTDDGAKAQAELDAAMEARRAKAKAQLQLPLDNNKPKL
jgi:hypothetical protein